MPTSTCTRPFAAPFFALKAFSLSASVSRSCSSRRDVVREHGADADLLGGVGERLELAVHVVDRRDAALDRLAVAR